MAKLNGPLMSFGASGKLGNALVFGSWKGIATARQYVTPSNPRSQGQVAQRALMSLIVGAWRRPAFTAALRAAWDLLAASYTAAVSGFNVFTSNLVKLVAEVPTASYVTSIGAKTSDAVQLVLQNLDDGATGDEAGNFAVAYGNAPGNMVYGVSQPIYAGVIEIDVSNTFSPGDTVYFSARKAGTGVDVYERSGIVAVVLE